MENHFYTSVFSVTSARGFNDALIRLEPFAVSSFFRRRPFLSVFSVRFKTLFFTSTLVELDVLWHSWEIMSRLKFNTNATNFKPLLIHLSILSSLLLREFNYPFFSHINQVEPYRSRFWKLCMIYASKYTSAPRFTLRPPSQRARDQSVTHWLEKQVAREKWIP